MKPPPFSTTSPGRHIKALDAGLQQGTSPTHFFHVEFYCYYSLARLWPEDF